MFIPIECVTTKDVSMRFFRFGTGAATMVILPGLSVKSVMESATMIAGQYDVFARDYTVYVFERRAVLPKPYTLEDMAEDTVCAMEALGLKDIYLFGASQGGMMAMLIAAKHPQLIKKMILGSTAAKVNERGFAAIREWMELAAKKDAAGLYDSFCRKIYPADIYEKYKSLFSGISETVSDRELARFITLAGTIEGFDCIGELAKIRCPVLIIGSQDDAVLGSEPILQIYNALAAVTDTSYYLYTDRGHDAYDTAPDYQQRMYDCFAHGDC